MTFRMFVQIFWYICQNLIIMCQELCCFICIYNHIYDFNFTIISILGMGKLKLTGII